MKNRLDFTTSSQTVGSIYMEYIDKTLNLKPDYQREYVWSDAFKYKLIYSIIRNYPIGNITVRKLTYRQEGKIKSEIVDGQQRLTTIFDYMDGKLVVSGEDSYEIMYEVISLYTDEELKNKEIQKLIAKYDKRKKLELTYSLLPNRAQVRFGTYNLSISTINQADDKEVAEYFRFVQNQERLRAGEIINAFTESPIDDILLDGCNVEKLMEILGFDNSRKEFNKLFSAIVGLKHKKLNLGCKDSDIIDFVRKETATPLDEGIKNTASRLAKELNYLTNANLKIRSNKRFVKLLMILVLFENISFEGKEDSILRNFELFNANLSAFNSAKKKKKKKVFDGKFTDKSQENHRLVALITKGGHNYERVNERSKIMKDILINDYRIEF